MSKILITGGTGRLAAELKKVLKGEYFGIEHFDFTYTDEIPNDDWNGERHFDMIVHMGAYTDVKKAEVEKIKCFNTNVLGTFNLVNKFKYIPFVYISTEYANFPLGIYALTKRLGEEIVATHPNHIIVRTSFKPRPFPFPKAYGDQYTQGDYVDIIAQVIADIINTWDRKTSGLVYAGTGRKRMIDLARQTRPDVEENSVDDYNREIGMELIPKDYL